MFLALAGALVASPAHATWLVSGNPVCADTTAQSDPVIVADGASGAIIFWADGRHSGDIYGQSLDSTGVRRWTQNGVAICAASHAQVAPAAVPTSGGAVVCWEDHRNSDPDIYAQRVDMNGVGQWGTDGLALGATFDAETSPIIIQDGSPGILVEKGFIVAWLSDEGSTASVRVQHVGYNGDAMWSNPGSGGVTLTSTYFQNGLNSLVMCTDGMGQASAGKGAYVAWQQVGPSGGLDIFVGRVNASGIVQWGGPVCGATGGQTNPSIAFSAGSRTAIVTWDDQRSSDRDIWAQKIDATGASLWTANGEPVCRYAGSDAQPKIISDGADGAIIVWSDQRNATETKIYAQRLDPNGQPLWTLDGIPVCTAPGSQSSPVIASDLAGGAMVAWNDYRNGNLDVIAQRLDPNGVLLWGGSGVPLTTAASSQFSTTLISDGEHGLLAAWQDQRDGNADIYATRVIAADPTVDVPSMGPTGPALSLLSSNPTRVGARLRIELPEASPLTVDVIDAQGRHVRTIEAGSTFAAGPHEIDWDGSDASGRQAAPGLYFIRARSNAETRVARVAALR